MIWDLNLESGFPKMPILFQKATKPGSLATEYPYEILSVIVLYFPLVLKRITTSDNFFKMRLETKQHIY